MANQEIGNRVRLSSLETNSWAIIQMNNEPHSCNLFADLYKAVRIPDLSESELEGVFLTQNKLWEIHRKTCKTSLRHHFPNASTSK